jgi:hypothetical protein
MLIKNPGLGSQKVCFAKSVMGRKLGRKRKAVVSMNQSLIDDYVEGNLIIVMYAQIGVFVTITFN